MHMQIITIKAKMRMVIRLNLYLLYCKKYFTT